MVLETQSAPQSMEQVTHTNQNKENDVGQKTESKNKVTFSQSIIKEFPPLTQRTKSWHGFNKCFSTIR